MYFIYCRDRTGTAALRDELVEAHWTFMDGYADQMIARGPTLTPDRTEATGSLHIVDLPDAAAARTFAFEEPNYRAGIYRDVLIRRWQNLLGRTMREYAGAGLPRFLVIGQGTGGEGALDGPTGSVIARGPLLSEDGEWLGSALLAELPDPVAVEAVLAADPGVQVGWYESLEVHPWQFGGRPDPDDS